MLKLESVAAFVSIVDTGSIAGAARRLCVSKSVVSERLVDLERALGTRFLQRTTRKLSLTQDGSAFYSRARQILRDVDSAASELAKRRGTLVGPLRISAPVSFGQLHLGPALFGLVAKYPGLELTLELDDRFVVVRARSHAEHQGGVGAIDFFSQWKAVYVDYSDTLQRAQIDRGE